MSPSASRYRSNGRGAPEAESRSQKWARVRLHVLDREHELDDERALDLGRDHPRHEMHALEHHRPALLRGAFDRSAHADEHVAGLRQEAVRGRVLVVVVLRRAASKLE